METTAWFSFSICDMSSLGERTFLVLASLKRPGKVCVCVCMCVCVCGGGGGAQLFNMLWTVSF